VFLAIRWTVLMRLLVSLGISADGFNLAFYKGNLGFPARFTL